MKGFIHFLIFVGICVFVLGIVFKLAGVLPVMNVYPVTLWRFCMGCWLLATSLAVVQLCDAKAPQA